MKRGCLVAEEAQLPGQGGVRDLRASHLGEIEGGMASIRQEECPLEKEKTEDKRDVLSNKNRLQKSGEKGQLSCQINLRNF